MEINRDKLIRALRDNCKCLDQVKNCAGCAEKYPWLCKQERQLFKAAADMLEADGAKRVPEGQWVHEGVKVPNGADWYYCSECGKRDVQPLTNYCPDCGAKMEVEA